MRTDTITLSGITAIGHHGVFESEKRDGQPFTLDVVLHTDIRPAAASDNVADTAHYGELGEMAIVGSAPTLLEHRAFASDAIGTQIIASLFS